MTEKQLVDRIHRLAVEAQEVNLEAAVVLFTLYGALRAGIEDKLAAVSEKFCREILRTLRAEDN